MSIPADVRKDERELLSCQIYSDLDAKEAIVSTGYGIALKAKPQATNGIQDYGPAN